jgi:hypothetical protein
VEGWRISKSKRDALVKAANGEIDAVVGARLTPRRIRNDAEMWGEPAIHGTFVVHPRSVVLHCTYVQSIQIPSAFGHGRLQGQLFQ